jgi:hypothetical protein
MVDLIREIRIQVASQLDEDIFELSEKEKEDIDDIYYRAIDNPNSVDIKLFGLEKNLELTVKEFLEKVKLIEMYV